MNLEQVKKLNTPTLPGSYQFYDENGKIIYIGKAANLRSRVLSYWRESADHTPAKYSMLKKIVKIKWIETDSEIEALLLEANLIKKYQPEYNISLRDDKRFVYIKISTEEKYPRIFMTRNLDHSGRFFGPFTSTESVRETLKVIRKIWPYRSCRTMPKKVCLYYQIGKCPGVCEEKISVVEYAKIIKQIVLFLEGRKREVVKDIQLSITNYELRITNLKENSEKYTETEEKINFLKYQLLNLRKVLEHSRILSVGEKYAADVVELAKILGLPKAPERIEGYDISNIFGREAVGSMVVFAGGEPNKSEYKKFKIKNVDAAGDVGMLKEVLGRRFKHFTPHPDPLLNKERGQEGTGRDASLLLAKEEDRRRFESWPSPDLIIVDGGKAQLNAVLTVLRNYNLKIFVLAVSKGEGLRSSIAPDKIFFPGEKKPLVLPLASPALHLIKRVRDEAHRFAIGYHRKLRGKSWLK
ncbi:MAG: excinuclease ABC subunit UvrC [Patescibacteria group bacterium]|nr:excinuclease ABC subunit UvrC [Patescibacteria group bacterium]MDD4611157.1 excinuclease ABC subunit UvrC [Patescibacteria group bacterium]